MKILHHNSDQEINFSLYPDFILNAGEILSVDMKTAEITEEQFSSLSGINPSTLKEVLSGERPVDREIAEGIAKVLGPSAEHWLRLEATYRKNKARFLQREQAETNSPQNRQLASQ